MRLFSKSTKKTHLRFDVLFQNYRVHRIGQTQLTTPFVMICFIFEIFHIPHAIRFQLGVVR